MVRTGQIITTVSRTTITSREALCVVSVSGGLPGRRVALVVAENLTRLKTFPAQQALEWMLGFRGGTMGAHRCFRANVTFLADRDRAKSLDFGLIMLFRQKLAAPEHT